jgi:hypothetical protein
MAKVSEGTNGMLFEKLSAPGIGLVNDFLAKHRSMERPSPTPSDRLIGWNTPEEKQELIGLARRVEALDPD